MKSFSANKFKEEFIRFPVEARQSIEKAMSSHIEPLRQSIAKQDEALQKEIVDLKDKLVKANEDRLRSEVEINELNDRIRQQRVFEDVKRRELELMMFDKKNRFNGGAKNRTEIPDTVPKAFEFPQMPRNYEQRLKHKMENKVMKEAPMLYGKTTQLRVPRGTAAAGDVFSDPLMAGVLMDSRRAANAEFYATERLAIPLNDKFPSLADDYSNKQGLVIPRFQNDLMDDDRNLLDIFSNNEERLRALEVYGAPVYKAHPKSAKERVDFDRVDRIIDSLDAFKDKYFDDKNQMKIFHDSSAKNEPQG